MDPLNEHNCPLRQQLDEHKQSTMITQITKNTHKYINTQNCQKVERVGLAMPSAYKSKMQCDTRQPPHELCSSLQGL